MNERFCDAGVWKIFKRTGKEHLPWERKNLSVDRTWKRKRERDREKTEKVRERVREKESEREREWERKRESGMKK